MPCQLLALRPVEELLLSGFPCALLHFVCQMCQAQGGILLCGHSLGATVALAVAARLTTCGLCVRGVVVLEARIGESTTTLSTSSMIPRNLAQTLVPVHFRLPEAGTVDFVAPLVPRGSLPSRFLRSVHVAPWQHCRAAWSMPQQLVDGDHYDLPNSHMWDITRCIRDLVSVRCVRLPKPPKPNPKRKRRRRLGRLHQGWAPACGSMPQHSNTLSASFSRRYVLSHVGMFTLRTVLTRLTSVSASSRSKFQEPLIICAHTMYDPVCIPRKI
ncbi:ANXA6 [Symbiodinium natans]|uniref:ANXA6 protein n=1 Tax=Symbiodinium natans TaxID=878477 RepID=A0A812TVU5_9DINO|nr:ANXA6 [Symbiodinium natans]